MAPRTSWKGFLKLSLVSVPVKAFTANNTSEEVRLNQLHKDCHGRDCERLPGTFRITIELDIRRVFN